MADLFHIGLTVSDLNRSINFYRDIVGMTAHGDEVEIDSEGFGRLTANPGAVLRCCPRGPFYSSWSSTRREAARSSP